MDELEYSLVGSMVVVGLTLPPSPLLRAIMDERGYCLRTNECRPHHKGCIFSPGLDGIRMNFDPWDGTFVLGDRSLESRQHECEVWAVTLLLYIQALWSHGDQHHPIRVFHPSITY